MRNRVNRNSYIRVEDKCINMNQKHKPSILLWGKSLINFSIFSEKMENMKSEVELLKIQINKLNLFIHGK